MITNGDQVIMAGQVRGQVRFVPNCLNRAEYGQAQPEVDDYIEVWYVDDDGEPIARGRTVLVRPEEVTLYAAG